MFPSPRCQESKSRLQRTLRDAQRQEAVLLERMQASEAARMGQEARLEEAASQVGPYMLTGGN